jgi:hypothetical protein
MTSRQSIVTGVLYRLLSHLPMRGGAINPFDKNKLINFKRRRKIRKNYKNTHTHKQEKYPS